MQFFHYLVLLVVLVGKNLVIFQLIESILLPWQLKVTNAKVRCDRGTWEDVKIVSNSTVYHRKRKNNNYFRKYARSGYNAQNTSVGIEEWLKQSCPVQTFEFSCYYHESYPDNLPYFPANRAKELDYRRWNPHIHPVNPLR